MLVPKNFFARGGEVSGWIPDPDRKSGMLETKKAVCVENHGQELSHALLIERTQRQMVKGDAFGGRAKKGWGKGVPNQK